jgi:hypothetical protein
MYRRTKFFVALSVQGDLALLQCSAFMWGEWLMLSCWLFLGGNIRVTK